METKYYIAEKIKEFREAKGWTQTELGAKLDPPKRTGTISSWETGRTRPDGDTMLNLCLVFEVDISDFYPPSRVQYGVVPFNYGKLSEKEEELIELFRSLSKEGQHAVLVGLRDYVKK